MTDAYNQIHRRKRLRFYGILLMSITVLTLAIPAAFIYHRSSLLISRGYSRHIFRADYDPFTFLAKCYLTRACPDSLRSYLFATPVMPAAWWGYLSLGFLAASFAAITASRAIRDDREPGVAHWATKSELKDAGYFDGLGYLGVAHGHKLSYPGDNLFTTTLVLGNPGSGKTRNVLEPMIIEAIKQGMSVVVFEQKYPNADGFPKYFEWIEQNTDAHIEVFLPNEPNTPTFPLLEIAKEFAGAQLLSTLFYPEVDASSTLAHHFARERPLLALVLYLEAKYGEGAIGNVLEVFSSGLNYFTNYINEAYASGKLTKAEYQQLQSFFELSNSQKSETIDAIKGRLQPMHNPVIAQSFRYSSRNVDLYGVSKRQTVLYVALDQAMLGSGISRGALQAIIRALIFSFLQDAKNNANRVTVPTVIYFDEFPFLGYMPGLADDLNTLRERRVGYVFAAQNLPSIKKAYKDHPEEFEAIVASVGHFVLTHKTNPEDVIKLARHIGKTTSVRYSHSTSSEIIGRPFEGKRALRTELEGDDLIRPDEFRNLRIGQAIVLSQETFPIVTEWPLLDNLHIPKVGHHPATDPLFQQVRRYLPKPPRTPSQLALWLSPYVYIPQIDDPLTRTPAPLSPASAKEPPASLRSAAATGSPASNSATSSASTPTTPPPPSTPEPNNRAAAPASNPSRKPKQENPGNNVTALNEWIKSTDGAPVVCRFKIGGSLAPNAARLARMLDHPLPLPGDLAIKELESARFIKMLSENQLEITPPGYKSLDESARSVLSRHAARTVLVEWIEDNAALVKGHPKYAPDDTLEPKAELTPDGHLIVLRTALSDEVLKGAAPTKEYLTIMQIDPNEDVRLTIKGRRRRAYRIPLPTGLYPTPTGTENAKEVG